MVNPEGCYLPAGQAGMNNPGWQPGETDEENKPLQAEM
jgi:hypothetical protein